MTVVLRPDLCVIGGGPGGIAAARTAARLGAKVVLVEKRALGGTEHLRNAWQIQALTGLAARVAALRSGARFGLAESEARIDFKRLHRETDLAMGRFMRDDSPARLAALNVRIVPAAGVFTSPSRFEAGEFAIDARRFLLAIGSVPTPLAVAGTELIRPVTAERIAELATIPKKLAVIGSSHASLLLAQAFLRIGSKVTLLQPGAFLQGEDPELAAPLHDALRLEGMEILENAHISGVELPRSGLQASGLRVLLGNGGAVEASHLIHADHRPASVEGLGLKTARVSYDKDGVKRDADLRCSNPKIYAIGDGLDSFQSIASGRREAEWVIELLFGQGRPAPLRIARVIGADPEIAVIGLSEEAARTKYRAIRVLRAGFCDNLRAQTAAAQRPSSGSTAKAPAGHVKIITDSHGYLLGAGIAGPQARELIGLFGLALAKRLKAKDLAALASSEPTLMEICRTAALASAPQTGKVGRRILSAWRSLR